MKSLREFFSKLKKAISFLYIVDNDSVSIAIKRGFFFINYLVIIDNSSNTIIEKTNFYYLGLFIIWHNDYIVLRDTEARGRNTKCFFNSKLEYICKKNGEDNRIPTNHYSNISFNELPDGYIVVKRSFDHFGILLGGGPISELNIGVLNLNIDAEPLFWCSSFYYLGNDLFIVNNNSQGFVRKFNGKRIGPYIYNSKSREIKDLPGQIVNPKKDQKYFKYKFSDFYGYLNKDFDIVIKEKYEFLGDVSLDEKVPYKNRSKVGFIDINTGIELS